MGSKKLRVVVLGAGFGGLELAASLSEGMGDRLALTLIDQSGHFFFGYSKLDVMFGHRSAASVRHAYSRISMPGVRFCQETITSIDPVRRRVTTDHGAHQADVLVVALGADYDVASTPGLAEGGCEFYSFGGAERANSLLGELTGGHILIGVTGFPFKCPPAPSETALLLPDYRVRRRIRQQCRISLVMPFELPVPPSYGTSKALLRHFREKHISYIPGIMVGALDPGRKVAELDDGREIPFDLFLGIPEHCAPRVLEESGLLFDGWIPADRRTLKTRYSEVYAIGDVTSVGTPKAGMFASNAARAAARCIMAAFKGREFEEEFNGEGSCYVEFGEGRVGRADVKFFPDPAYPTGSHQQPTLALAEEKQALETFNLKRWFR